MYQWLPMSSEDIAEVKAISDAVHGDYTELAEVYEERLRLYPKGCFIFRSKDSIIGYLVSHPWTYQSIPALNEFIGTIPDNADCFYLHDLALLESGRGTGAGRAALALVIEAARRDGFNRITLTAVNGAESFWGRQGFQAASAQMAESYGADSVPMERIIECGQ